MEQFSESQVDALVRGLEAELKIFRVASSVQLVIILALSLALVILLGKGA